MVLNSVVSDTLKNLYLYRNGENKGFIQLIKKQELDKVYEDRFKEYFVGIAESTIGELIQELHVLCCSKSDVDADVQELVDKLYELTVGDVNG